MPQTICHHLTIIHQLKHLIPHTIRAIKLISFPAQDIRSEFPERILYPLPHFGIFGDAATGAS